MLRASFYGFSTAMRALNASQKALDVTGQNIANVNTNGYTRQRLDLYSSPSGGFSDRYMSRPTNNIGQGVIIGSVSQIRDPFLDTRFRREATKLGEMEGKLSALEDLSSVFDEISSAGLGSQITDFIKQLQSLQNQTGNAEFDGIAKASAEVLTKIFNQYSKQIEGIRKQETVEIKDNTIPHVNEILKSIAVLNQSIKEDQIHGNSALELLDQRNALLDELSTYVNINISNKAVEISPGVIVDQLNVDFIGANGTFKLIDDTKTATLEVETDPDINQTTIKYTYGDDEIENFEEEISSGILKGNLDMLNKGGEFDNPPSTARGIAYYEQVINKIANQFATAFNDANNRGAGGEDHPLFASTDGSDITAGNLTISDGWKNNEYGIHNTVDDQPGNDDGARDNIHYMISLFSKKFEFLTDDGVTLFNGTIQEGISQIGNVLALDIKSSNALADNYATVMGGVQNLKDSVSGVTLDEEGINLLRYQKSYNAAARLMTTLDEALDTIINGMGRVGR